MTRTPCGWTSSRRPSARTRSAWPPSRPPALPARLEPYPDLRWHLAGRLDLIWVELPDEGVALPAGGIGLQHLERSLEAVGHELRVLAAGWLGRLAGDQQGVALDGEAELGEWPVRCRGFGPR